MDCERIALLLESVISRLDDLQSDVDQLSVDLEQIRMQEAELGEEIASVKRAVEEIDPIL